MSELRSYTVDELDELRKAVETRMTFGTSVPEGGNFGYNPTPTALYECVRTHMLAGHTAKDIIDADTQRQKREKDYWTVQRARE